MILLAFKENYSRNQRQYINSTDERWKWFEGCLGALDGTHIRVQVSVEDKPRYRTRKNEIATNVLGVCSQDMQFIYVLTGWKGSAADSTVLRDAISRRNDFVFPEVHIILWTVDIQMVMTFLHHFEAKDTI
ncbi:hypothetical protein Sango_0812400 [Sesamum angolense]|uniref:DDE Tnp4 domain-containing protein n=1 Tax=Sesamum angolense TaxID=2727404 RepID=A0AAE1X367_9LAMI|nr:hypothetical protein Sango_0812400 [Sesamum angolense]